MKTTGSARQRWSYRDEKEGNDISVMTDCQAVVEKKGFIATGVLTYAEGEIIEIEFPQYEQFVLGESVRILVYTKVGIFTFDTMVVARGQGSVIVIHPPEHRKRFMDKRQYPRVPVRQRGKVIRLFGPREGTDSERSLEEPLQAVLDNISLTGAGIIIEGDLSLQVESGLEFAIDLGFELICQAEVVHRRAADSGTMYGMRFVHIRDEHLQKLRSYILKNQIEVYYQTKGEQMRIGRSMRPVSDRSLVYDNTSGDIRKY